MRFPANTIVHGLLVGCAWTAGFLAWSEGHTIYSFVATLTALAGTLDGFLNIWRSA